MMDWFMTDIRATRARIESDLGKGSARTFEEYKIQVGRVRGLNEAEELLKEIYKKLNRGEEEAPNGND